MDEPQDQCCACEGYHPGSSCQAEYHKWIAERRRQHADYEEELASMTEADYRRDLKHAKWLIGECVRIEKELSALGVELEEEE